MSGLPRWAVALLRVLSPPGELDDVLGDLDEAHRRRMQRRGSLAAHFETSFEIIEMAVALFRARAARGRIQGSTILQDYKLGIRMLAKYPGLTIAGGLALAIAIGLGAGWYDITRDLWRPKLPLSEGDRIVEIEMRDSRKSGDERRIMHDFLNWRRDARSVTELGAYRTVPRNLIIGDARMEPVTAAETTASAFQLTRVPPLLGRPLVEADEQPGAPPVVVLSHMIWQRQFGGRADIIGQAVQIGRGKSTVVGVMPEGFAFPINHRLWTPLVISPGGYEPLTGPPIRVFARLAPGITQDQAYAEITAMTQAVAAVSPQTHAQLAPRVLAYGGESPGDTTVLEFAITHLPILLVLAVACVNVGTLVYARTATREAEIAMRYALGAGRLRIVTQLFIEALVLSTLAAIVGLTGAHFALKWGFSAFYSGDTGGLPFWVNPGLKPVTIAFAIGLTVLGSVILGVLPALKVTRAQVQGQLRNLGAGGATLRFGRFWTAAMIGQVALTVICLPPARGISEEALRDREIRARFPTNEYLSVRLDLDRQPAPGAVEEPDQDYAVRFAHTFDELERQLMQEPGVRAVTFGDRLPGMDVAVRTAEVETTPPAAPVLISDLWVASVGTRYFEAFDVPVLAGRDFDAGDRAPDARTVLVNEAFVRRYMDGASPVGTRVRYAAADAAHPEPWLEIVGVVGDIGMTPTDRGEAPYLFHAASPATASPLVVGVRVAGDPHAIAPRVRAIAAALDPGLRLSDLRSLEDLTWNQDVPMMVGAGAVLTIVSLGLLLSAAGIYALVSVSVARRTKEIGLRAALGATRSMLLGGVLYRAVVLIGSGVLVGNAVLLFIITLSPEVDVAAFAPALIGTSVLMLGVGLLACVEPALRALRIQPTDALKES